MRAGAHFPIEGQYTEEDNLPTVDQAFAAVHVCQWLSNCYMDIHLFRYDTNTKHITIIAGVELIVVIPPSGDWGFENE